MKQLRFDYSMCVSYDTPVDRCWFTLKCLPRETARQRVMWVNTELTPEVPLSRGVDGFGNAQLYGQIPEPHSSFALRVTGQVEIGQLLFEEEADPAQLPLYRCSGPLTTADESLRACCRDLTLPENEYERALALMQLVHREMAYTPGATGPDTPAALAWALKQGVCQDYAHIFVTLCRLAGLTARYVTGLIIGEGASHAWAEVLYRGRWIGMDPTNDLLVNDAYVRFAHGRDASDCPINRGLLRGLSSQTQTVTALVTEL